MVALWFSFWIISVPIVIRDINELRIPNIYLKTLSFIVVIGLILQGIGPLINLLECGIVLLIFFAVKVGMGDIKLLALSFMIFNSRMSFALTYYLMALLACACAQLIFTILVVRQFPERIPLAPSIYLAFALNLGAG
jgi:Flp pilus assembly protein protease CpaA